MKNRSFFLLMVVLNLSFGSLWFRWAQLLNGLRIF